MKKPYQIEAQRAVKQLEAMAADGNPAVQMMLPLAEMVGCGRHIRWWNASARLRNAGMLTLEEMAQRLNLCSCSVKDWRDLGWLRAHRYNDRGECLYELPGSDLPKKGAWGLRKYRAAEVSSNRAEAVQYEA